MDLVEISVDGVGLWVVRHRHDGRLDVSTLSDFFLIALNQRSIHQVANRDLWSFVREDAALESHAAGLYTQPEFREMFLRARQWSLDSQQVLQSALARRLAVPLSAVWTLDQLTNMTGDLPPSLLALIAPEVLQELLDNAVSRPAAFRWLRRSWNLLPSETQNALIPRTLRFALFTNDPDMNSSVRAFLNRWRSTLPLSLQVEVDNRLLKQRLDDLWKKCWSQSYRREVFAKPQDEMQALIWEILDNSSGSPEGARALFDEMGSRILPLLTEWNDPMMKVLPTVDDWVAWAVMALDSRSLFFKRVQCFVQMSPHANELLLGAMGPHLRADFKSYQDDIDLMFYFVLLPPLIKRLKDAMASSDEGTARRLTFLIANAFHVRPDIDLNDFLAPPGMLRPLGA